MEVTMRLSLSIVVLSLVAAVSACDKPSPSGASGSASLPQSVPAAAMPASKDAPFDEASRGSEGAVCKNGARMCFGAPPKIAGQKEQPKGAQVYACKQGQWVLDEDCTRDEKLGCYE